MRFFFAYNGSPPVLDVLDKAGRAPYNLLLSYEYLKAGHLERLRAMVDRWFLLDSGAFSAWTKKKEISLTDYIETVGEVQEVMGERLIAISLDVIPGEFGRRPTKLEVEEACERGWENYQRLRRETKAEIMPVFHQHDDWVWLDRYLKEDCYLLGISPANDLSTSQRRPYLSRCFATVRDQKRCHGLAATSVPLMLDYPWYSADSATWVSAPAWEWTASWNPMKRVLKMLNYKDREKIKDGFDLRYMDRPGYFGYYERMMSFVEAYLEIEAFVNRVWARKGFSWSD